MVRRAQEAVDDIASDDPEHAHALFLLGHALRSRALSGAGQPSDLQEATAALRKAVEVSAPEDPHRADYLAELGFTLGDRSQLENDADLAEECVDVAREAIRRTPKEHPHYPARVTMLAAALTFGTPSDEQLAEAVNLCQQALDAAQPDDPRSSRYHYAHAFTLLRKAVHTGDRKVSLKAARAAMTAIRGAHPYDSQQVKFAQVFQAARRLAGA